MRISNLTRKHWTKIDWHGKSQGLLDFVYMKKVYLLEGGEGAN